MAASHFKRPAAMTVTLIFPCCVPAGESYAEEARQHGESVVAASSLAYDPTAAKFETWFRLPDVYDAAFVPDLAAAIKRHGITRIFCPVPAAHVVLSRLVTEKRILVSLVGDMPIRRQVRDHKALMREAGVYCALVAAIAGGRSKLRDIEVAAVLRQALNIYGESGPAKIAAMMGIFADAPAGDVVEIGVLFGRTACTLALMARWHKIGAVLAIDPWSAAAAVQRDSPAELRALVDAWDIGDAFEAFLVAMLPVAAGSFNYLALRSRDAHPVWRSRHVETPEFGAVDYCGSIAVLHIDGNHDYESVREDCAVWLPALAPGGWLILDDYVWLHGSGPRRVGDELLTAHSDRIVRAFVCDGALFIQFGG